MTDLHEIDTVLQWVAVRRQTVERDLRDLREQTRSTDDRLEGIEGRLGALGLEIRQTRVDDSSNGRGRSGAGPAGRPAWDQVVGRAEQNLRERGIDPAALDLDDLLDRDEVERINRRFADGFRVHARLDA